MPLASASASPECSSPSERRRSSEKPRGESTEVGGDRRASALEHAAADLIELDRFEQRPEVAFAEALIALALDDLEEDRTDHGRGEDLQQHLVLRRRAVDKNAVLLEPRRVFLVVGKPRGKEIVVRIRRVLESDA